MTMKLLGISSKLAVIVCCVPSRVVNPCVVIFIDLMLSRIHRCRTVVAPVPGVKNVLRR